LQRAGVTAYVLVSDVDEDSTVTQAVSQYGELAPEDVALLLARAKCEAVAERLARQPLGAVSATKRLMRNAELLTTQMDAESACFAERLRTAEAHEAFRAFVDRRPPNFSAVAS